MAKKKTTRRVGTAGLQTPAKQFTDSLSQSAEDRLAAAVALVRAGAIEFWDGNPCGWDELARLVLEGIEPNRGRIWNYLRQIHGQRGKVHAVAAGFEGAAAAVERWFIPANPMDNPELMINQLGQQWAKRSEPRIDGQVPISCKSGVTS